MGAASLLENIIDRSISDLAQFWDQLQSRADASSLESRADASSLADFESRLKACEESYGELLSQLQRAKEILTTPGLDKSLQVHWLHIENGKSQKEIERLRGELTHVKGKLPENRKEFHIALERQRKRTEDAEQAGRALRDENKSLRAVITKAKGTHRVEPTKPKRHKKRSTAKPIPQGESLFAISAREARVPKEHRRRPKPRQGKRRKPK